MKRALSCILFLCFKICLTYGVTNNIPALSKKINLYSAYSKPPDTTSVNRHIDSLERIKPIAVTDLLALDSLYTLRRYYYHWRELTFKFELGSRVDVDKETRIRVYRQVRVFPWYTVHHHFYTDEFYELYRISSMSLMELYQEEGDLESLLHFDITPSMWSTLASFLKIAIENTGGTWDKGEIPMHEDAFRLDKRN